MKFRSDPQRGRAAESRGRGRRIPLVVGAVLAAAALAACSSTGGKPAGTGGGGGGAGGVNTPRVTIAMVTHEAPGDTFWDLIRKGAQAAADKDNIELKYSANKEGPEQGNLVQNAVDSKVAGLAVTLATARRREAGSRGCRRRGNPGGRLQLRHRPVEGHGCPGVLRSGREARGRDRRQAAGHRRGQEGHLRDPGAGLGGTGSPLRRRQGRA